MDWSIKVSKDFVFIYYFKLKNAVRPNGTFVGTIVIAVAILLAVYCLVQECFYLFRLVITVFPYFDFKSLFQ